MPCYLSLYGGCLQYVDESMAQLLDCGGHARVKIRKYVGSPVVQWTKLFGSCYWDWDPLERIEDWFGILEVLISLK